MENSDSEVLSAPQVTWKKVRSTWLSKKPATNSVWMASFSTLGLLTISLYYWKYVQGGADWMVASGEQILMQNEWWRLWTATLIHSDGAHLAANSFLFFILGYFLYGYFGFFVFPFLAFVLGGVANFFSIITYSYDIKLLGASGVVYLMGGMWLALYLLIDQQRTIPQRLLRSFGVALGLFMPASAFEPSISYRTHLFGFIVGVTAGILYYLVRRKTFLGALVEEVIVEDP